MRRLAITAIVLPLLFAGSAQAASVKLFQSPSGNIGCAMGSFGARCDIAKHSWDAPPKPADCPVDWGNGLAVDKHGKADYVCAGDTALHQGNHVHKGDVIKKGGFRCKSLGAAMRCVNLDNGHGFKLSRHKVHLF